MEQRHYAAAGNIAEEVLSAIRTVVAFGGENKETTRYVSMSALHFYVRYIHVEVANCISNNNTLMQIWASPQCCQEGGN